MGANLAWALCISSTQRNGPHELKVDIVSKDGTVFWVDLIECDSLPNPDLTGKYNQIVPFSQSVQYYGNGWEPVLKEDSERLTYAQGSRLSVRFFGSMSLWYH